MSVIIDTLRAYNAYYLVVDVDPSVGTGARAGINSLAITATGFVYQKTSAPDTGWTLVVSPAGGAAVTQRTVAANDAILTTDDIIFLDSSGGPFNLSLPDPTTIKRYSIIDAAGFLNTNPVTLTPFAAENIEGLTANKDLLTDWGGYTLVPDGVDWFMG